MKNTFLILFLYILSWSTFIYIRRQNKEIIENDHFPLKNTLSIEELISLVLWPLSIIISIVVASFFILYITISEYKNIKKIKDELNYTTQNCKK